MKNYLRLSFMLMLTFVLSELWAQERSVSGKVTSIEDGSALPGVNVVLKGTTNGTVTDVQGNYKLNVPADGGTLIFSFIGLATEEVPVGSRSVIDIQMSSDITQLSEVVVVGYGDQSKRLSTQSVSTVSAKSIENLPVLSAQEALQGQAAGVQMVGASGVIGSRPTVRVRGVASLSGAQPLYVVDGVPLANVSNSLNAGGVEMNPLANINSSEIESFTILKDAAAVAIYGSRGSNGVILINTKQGKRNQKTQFTADWFTGVVEPTKTRSMMNADQYREYSANAYVGQGIDPTRTPADFPQTSFDWPSAVLRTGSTDNYSLSARGGSDKTTFYISGTYLKQKGFTIGNDGDRLNFRLNLDHQATDKVRFGSNIGVSRVEFDRIDQDNSTFAPLTTAYLQLPWVEPRDANGQFVNTGFLANVIGIEALSDFNMVNRRLTGNTYVEVELIDGLTFKSDFGVDMGQIESFQRYPDVFSPSGNGSKRIWQDNKHLITNSLRYEKMFGLDHRFSIFVAHSWERYNQEVISVGGTGFVSDQLKNVASASNPTTTSATGTGWGIESYISRVNYSYQDRYVFEGSFRRDGSSRFGSNFRYGNFWALSGAWVLSDEAFMANADFIDLLKLKTSYGISGNDQIGFFGSLGLYGLGSQPDPIPGGPDYAGNAGLAPSNPANPDLTWEETAQFDVTLSGAFLNNRLRVDASYYVKKTDGLLLNVPLPTLTGFNGRTENVGKVENSGVDLMISGDIVRNNDLTVTTTLNLGFLKNEVTDLPDDNLDSEGRAFVGGSASQRAVEGYSINEFYLIRYKGINPQTGEAEWLDANGEVTLSPLAADRKLLGSAIPSLNGSFRADIRYKNFDLSALLTFVKGNKVYLGDMRFSDNPNNFDFFGLSTRLLDTWEQPGDQAYAPAFDATTFATFAQRSSQQLFDGSYARLKNISLGYSLPQSILDKTFITRARVYVMGQNLLTFASDLWDFEVEPEINGGAVSPQTQGESFFTAPQPKTISVGINLGF